MARSTTYRYQNLDAARGFAALAVVLHHACLGFTGIAGTNYIQTLCGLVPVWFFFLLSGFVLGKSLQREGEPGVRSYLAFITRRVFRLYPAVLFGLLLAIGCRSLLMPEDWYVNSAAWQTNTIIYMNSVDSFKDYLQEFLLYTTSLDNVLWTLQVEFCCSMLLPILHYISKWKPSWRIYIFIFLCVLPKISAYINWTGHYGQFFLVIFYLGYLLSYIEDYAVIIKALSPVKYVLIPGVVLFAVASSHSDQLACSIILSGFFVFLVSDSIPVLDKLLATYPASLLGRASFSLYVVHLPILFVLRTILQKTFPTLLEWPTIVTAVILFIGCAMVSIPLALAVDWWIERPLNRLGHKISQSMHPRPVRMPGVTVA